LKKDNQALNNSVKTIQANAQAAQAAEEKKQ
jgi:hypothetical protein